MRLVPALVAAALLTTSCVSASRPAATSAPDSPDVESSGAPSAPPTRALADPPEAFAERGVAVGPDSAAVGRTAAYSVADTTDYAAPPEIVAVDLATGEERWRWSPPAQGTHGRSPSMLAAERAGGGEHLVHANARTDPGSGTRANTHHAVVTALDADTGTELWTVTAALPDGFGDDFSVRVVGADADHVVCAVSGVDALPRALVVDVATSGAAWTDPGFQPLGLAATTVVGTGIAETYESSGPLRAIATDTLRPAWSRPDLTDAANKLVGTTLVQAAQRELSDPNTLLLDAATGAPVADLPDRYDCRTDQRDTLVCESYDTLIGVDAATGRQLWRLPDEATNRIKPALLTAFHGRVYAQAQRTPITLDARTGQDVSPDTTIAPEIVVPGYGIINSDNTFYAHPATS